MAWLGVSVHVCLLLSMEARKEFLAKRDELAPDKRLRQNLADLFLSGDISGKRARTLFQDADCANASNVSDLARGESDENAHRDVLRKLLSQTKWPRLFTFEVPIYDPKTDKESTAPLHMMLPHEVLSVMCRWSALDKLASTEHLRPELKSKLQEVRRFLSESNSSSSSASGPVTIAIGIWCDGVPIKGDKSESLEMLSMSFPGLQSSIRIPLTCLNKKFFLKSGATWDALFKVVAWSCHVMLSGFFPAKRWDGAPLDGQRARMAGQDLGARAALLEIRGDWAMLKASFRMPSWSSKRNCCFVCQATHANMRDVSPHAPWRTKMWSNAELLVDMMENYTMYSPIFEAPFVDIHTFAIDWLHCCDLGVCQDFLGNAMFLMQQKMPGRTVNDRINQLFVHIREYYKQHSVQDQLGALTLLMIRKPNKSPKLRSKAGEARGLVGWVKEACDQFLRGFGESSEEDTCRIAASHLYACYNNLSQESFNPELLSHHCREFLKLYVALERAVNDIDDPASADPGQYTRFKFKPKFHVWLHLCESARASPTLCWTYRDESFGGAVATQSRQRGGREGPSPMSQNLLNKFRAQHQVPEI